MKEVISNLIESKKESELGEDHIIYINKKSIINIEKKPEK